MLKKRITAVVILIIVVGAGIGTWAYLHKDNSPIPKNIRESVSFPIYYPSKLPDGYSLDENSARVDNKILFFSIGNKNRKISITEQSVPQNPPDLSAIQKFNTSFKSLPITGGT